MSARETLKLEDIIQQTGLKKSQASLYMRTCIGRGPGVRGHGARLSEARSVKACNIQEGWCPEPESNQRHKDFQSRKVPESPSGLIWPNNRTYKLTANMQQRKRGTK